MTASLRVGIVACSSPVGLVELDRGIERLRASGFDVVEHANVRARHFVTAGTDAHRADGLIDFAYDDATDVVWCARGGYGAARVVPLLVEATRSRGVPRRKTLVGYSDVTFLHEYVRQAWGWRTIHAPMVGAAASDAEWNAAYALVRGERPTLRYAGVPCLRWIVNRPRFDVVAPVVGGNLSLWATLAGTPWQPAGRDRILFLEDVGEKLYRVDRMAVQLEQAGMFEGALAIVLGDFTDCDDESPTMLAPDGNGGSTARVPLRPTLTLDAGLRETFGRIAERYHIPLAAGLPVGHGPGFWPLELGAPHALTTDGRLVPDGPRPI